MKRTMMLASLAALALAQPALAKAKPDPVAAAVADPARSEAARKLDESRMPAAILAFAGFKAGDAVADWGAGGGYYTELLADVVGARGRVYAVNAPAFTKPEAWAPILKAHANVLPLVAPAQAQWLAPGSLDGLFAHLEYHDLYFVSEKYQHPALDVPAVLANWFAAVKPGGHVVIVDHVGPAGDPRAVVDKFHRIDPARVRSDLEQAGFVFEATSDVLRRTDDPHDSGVFDPSVRGKTDRFALKFRRP